MRNLKLLLLLITLPLIIINCSKYNEEDNNPSKCDFIVDTMDFTFGIDYDHPEKYLIPGAQSGLSEKNIELVRKTIGTPNNTIVGIKQVCFWINQYFTFDNAGGALAGINTVDELFELKKFYGCHSLALIISSVLREFGFPAVMIETVDVKWCYDYRNGSVDYFKGHVMSEVYINNKWVLFDNDGSHVEDYDCTNPYISGNNHFEWGFFIFAKGVDIWDYKGSDETFTDDALLHFSSNIHCYEDFFYTTDYKWRR